MILKDARALQAHIEAVLGCYCVVPLGFKPDKYFCRIWSVYSTTIKEGKPVGEMNFHSREEFDKWLEHRNERKEVERLEIEKIEKKRRRSPLDILIDRACGIE